MEVVVLEFEHFLMVFEGVEDEIGVDLWVSFEFGELCRHLHVFFFF